MHSTRADPKLVDSFTVNLMNFDSLHGPQSNQWRVARGGGLEAIVAAMRRFREFAMVQLCALLCMVPLALENTILQAHLAGLGLPDIFIALTQHLDQVDLQAKGLVALGVLGQVRAASTQSYCSQNMGPFVPDCRPYALLLV